MCETIWLYMCIFSCSVLNIELNIWLSNICNCFQNIAVETFWQKQACVVTFLRRFGWPFCRLSAKQLSTIQPQLAANNVRLIGIGLEEVGVEQFIQGGFFTGGVYINSLVSFSILRT